VALSLGSPPLDVIQRPALRSPDFPPPSADGSDHLFCSSQSECRGQTGPQIIYVPFPCYPQLLRLFLPENQNSLAVRTEDHLISPEERVV